MGVISKGFLPSLRYEVQSRDKIAHSPGVHTGRYPVKTGVPRINR